MDQWILVGGGRRSSLHGYMGTYYTIHNVIHRRAADTGRLRISAATTEDSNQPISTCYIFHYYYPECFYQKNLECRWQLLHGKRKKTRSILEAARVFEVPA